MKTHIARFGAVAGAAVLALGALVAAPKPASADDASTAAIVGAAAVILGGIIYNANNQPYYVNQGQPIYVSQPAPGNWGGHRGGYAPRSVAHGGGNWHGGGNGRGNGGNDRRSGGQR